MTYWFAEPICHPRYTNARCRVFSSCHDPAFADNGSQSPVLERFSDRPPHLFFCLKLEKDHTFGRDAKLQKTRREYFFPCRFQRQALIARILSKLIFRPILKSKEKHGHC